MKKILMTCGETSGEEHAASFAREILSLDPSAEIAAMGGDILSRAGARIIHRIDDYAFMGFSEIARGIPRVLALEKDLKSRMASGEADLFVPVDYPGLNLRLAAYAKKKGVPVLYFISPQIWAWGGWRMARIRRSVDLMGVILPFEEEIYRNAGVPVFFAGHPMAGSIQGPEAAKQAPDVEKPFRIVLFPGSRSQEVARILPPMLSAASLISERFPEARFIIGLAPLIGEDAVEIPEGLKGRVAISRNGTRELGDAALVIAASGTVTLQSALTGTPMVVVYRTSGFTYTLGRLLVRIPLIAMPNVLAGEKVLPELVQGEANGAAIAREASSILTDPVRYRDISSRLIGLRKSLVRKNGLRELAAKALAMAANTDGLALRADRPE